MTEGPNQWGVRGLVVEGNGSSRGNTEQSKCWDGRGRGTIICEAYLVENGTRQNRTLNKWVVLKPACECCEGRLARREVGQSGEEDTSVGLEGQA